MKLISVLFLAVAVCATPKPAHGDSHEDWKEVYQILQSTGAIDLYSFDASASRQVIRRYVNETDASVGLVLDWCFYRFDDLIGHVPTDRVTLSQTAVNGIYWKWLEWLNGKEPNLDAVANARLVTSRSVEMMKRTGKYESFADPTVCSELSTLGLGYRT